MATEQELVAELESKLGLTNGLFFKLRSEDDWSFVVKLTALMDAALSYTIQEALGREEIADTIEALSFSMAKTGKLRVAANLGLLSPAHVRFLEQLGSIRNAFVHRIENASSTLTIYASALKKEQWHKVIRACLLIDPHADFKVTPDIERFALQALKHILWLVTTGCLLEIYLGHQEVEAKRLHTELAELFYERYGAESRNLFGPAAARTLSDLSRFGAGTESPTTPIGEEDQ